MSPEFWAAYHTYGWVFGLGALFGAIVDRFGRWAMQRQSKARDE